MSLDLDAIAAWTAANRRARDEYAAHPFAACLVHLCDGLNASGRHCHAHAREHNAAVRRMRKRRRQKEKK